MNMRLGANITERADGRFEARYEKGRDESGKIIFGSCYGKSRIAAAEKRAALLTSMGKTIPAAYILPGMEEYVPTENAAQQIIEENLSGEKYAILLDKILHESYTFPRAGLMLCLHMGLTPSETCALRFCDFDFEKGEVTINCVLSRVGRKTEKNKDEENDRFEIKPTKSPRTLPIPAHVARYLKRIVTDSLSSEAFIISGSTEINGIYPLSNELKIINRKNGVMGKISVQILRETFIRRALENGVDIYTLSKWLHKVRPEELQIDCSEHIRPQFERLTALEKYSSDTPTILCNYDGAKHMNLLILGAGGWGRVAKETAEALGIFENITFLDDNTEIPEVLDSLDNYKRFIEVYPIAFVAIGDNKLRKKLVEKLEEAGFILPAFIHPSAEVSPSVKVAPASIISAKATINAGTTIGKGVIVESGVIIDRDVTIGDFVHLDVSVTVKKGSIVDALSNIKSGTIVEM